MLAKADAHDRLLMILERHGHDSSVPTAFRETASTMLAFLAKL